MNLTRIILLLLALLQSSTALSEEISPYEAVEAALRDNLSAPEPDPDGRVQTLNKKGAMSPTLDEISREFVNFASKPGMKVLEIGGCYGLVCVEALKAGAKDYTINEMDSRHLKILALNVSDLGTNFLSKIHLIPGEFPKAMLSTNTRYDAILIARVLHFMSPPEVIDTLSQAHRLLKPGGCVYAVMLTPYVKGFRSFIPEFEQRIKNNDLFPGYIPKLSVVADRSIVPEKAIQNMDKPFLFFNTQTAQRIFTSSGFIVTKNIEIPLAYKSDIWQLDGRENIGVIACKPAL